MNILFLTSRLPYPPNRGDKVRTFFFLKEMSVSHKIFLVSLIEHEQEIRYQKELSKYCQEIYFLKHSKFKGYFNLIKAILSRQPFQVQYYQNTKLHNILKEIISRGKIDLIYTHLIRMAPYTASLPVKKILDYTDAISMEYIRSLPYRKGLINKLFFQVEAQRTARYEKRISACFDEAWFISLEDIEHLGFSHKQTVIQVPNPVLIDKFKKEYSRKNRIIFVGNLSVPHNIEAVMYMKEQVMPELARIDDKITFEIVGADANDQIRGLDSFRNITFKGFVEDLYKTLIEADIFVAPMFFSAGVQNKVLEAMAVGLPVITTANVARSIEAEHLNNIMIADTKKEYLEVIILLMQDEGLRKRIGRNGNKLIKSSFSQKLIGKLIEQRIHNIK